MIELGSCAVGLREAEDVFGVRPGVDRGLLAAAAGPRPLRPWTILRYDTRRFPFAAVLRRDVFRVADLARLHDAVRRRRERAGRPARATSYDNVTAGSIIADQPADADLWRLYHGFMLRVLAPWVGRSISYTSHPKTRVHLADTASVSSFHHDICVTKRIDQVNVWLPFTDVDGAATLWLESDYGRGDFQPIAVRYGELLVFDGGYLGHGSVRNSTDTTRVSFDLRFSYKRATTRAEGVGLMNRMIAVGEQPPSSRHQQHHGGVR